MVLRNMLSMTGLNVAKALSSLLVSTMMAGLVAPDRYGLVAFAIPLMAFITLVTDLGLTSAIVRHPNLDPNQAGATVGVLGLAGFVGASVMAASAQWIENATQLTGLSPVLYGFSAITAFSIWATAPRALLERRLAYPKISAIEAGGLLGALIVFVFATRASYGIFSLVFFHLVLQGIRAIGFSWLARGLFAINVGVSRILELAKIGGWVFLSNLMAYSARNVDRILIGSYLGASSLGLYSLGYQFMTIPLILFSWPVSGVLLSTLARLNNDQARKNDVTTAIITGTAAISMPMMTFLAIWIEFPVHHFLSDHWRGVGTIIATLAPVGAVQSIAAYNGAVLVEKGAVRLNFNLSLLSGLGLSAVFGSTVWLGLSALINLYAVVSILISFVMIYYMCRETGISWRRLMSCMTPGLAASFSAVCVTVTVVGWSPPSLLSWLSGVFIYITVVLFVFALDRRRLLTSLKALTERGPKPVGAVA